MAPEAPDGTNDDEARTTREHPALDSDARRLLFDLVSTPSVSGDEREAAELLVAFFEGNGREAYTDAVGNVRAPGDDGVLLTSHVDTVPGEVPVRITDDPDDDAAPDGGPVLWGRGSVDATGPLAAMAAAAVETGVSFAGVVGEETDSRGARHLVDDRAEPDAVVNGEPSGWEGITLGYRGFQAGEFSVSTPAAHTSRPEPNALELATEWWNRVADAFARDDDAAVFDSVTAKPVEMDGGLSDDGTAFEATVSAQFRLPPGTTAAAVRETAEDAAAASVSVGTDAGAGEAGAAAGEFEFAWGESIPPVLDSPRGPVATALRGAIRRGGGSPRLLRKTGTADVNLFAEAWDCPMATYGPGDSSLDHAPDERLPLAEFDRATDALCATCERLTDD
ncbi:[LysW]-lysine hydrolase [Candidatus Halobonum tyrrellensis]|uniref:Putative [LysW]-lysine/[LysW]-ornithine hydrolase n=1 Tax=Candidatus Halobonum tyrrellensis G22 TaxID=1324957 RepID=V4GWR0_9EURY|nr:[LysW]-lysine hydrolase [Candidatus Halobonum tyrrellensis]ESP89616.1 acetyl-lysine deacetylase [Candidatus Halobonum tyrrellensis G22]